MHEFSSRNPQRKNLQSARDDRPGDPEKYDLSKERAWKARKKGFFVKNYSRKQVIIDPGSYDPAISYSTAVVPGITATSGGSGMVRGGGAAVCLIIKSGEIIGFGLIFESI